MKRKPRNEAPDASVLDDWHRRVCANKIPYVSRQEARHQATRVTRTTGIRSKVYECRFCGYFHTTSLPSKRERKVRKAVRREWQAAQSGGGDSGA